MATTIKLKNSVTTTSVPSSLVQGEVAINITDKKVWVGNAATTPIQLLGDGGSVNFTTVDTTNLQVTNIKAKDGTASATIANSTGIFTHSTATIFTAGTVSLPAITTTGDTNTGIFFPAADTIAFTEGGVEAMRIDSSGNVGIGTTSPATQLNLNSTTPPVIRLQSATTNSAMGLDFFYTDAGNSKGGLTANFGAAEIRLSAGASGNSYFQSFYTNASERMRITSGGEVCIGTTNASGTAGIGAKILSTTGGFTFAQVTDKTVDGDATAYNYYSTGAAAYRFYVGAGGTVFATSIVISAISDERLKENIKDIDTGINTIMALKPRRFDWKSGKGQDKKNVAGFIAQEFETVFPECVSTTKAGADGIEYKNINHETLIPTLVKAIQELNAKVEAQAVRIAELESK